MSYLADAAIDKNRGEQGNEHHLEGRLNRVTVAQTKLEVAVGAGQNPDFASDLPTTLSSAQRR